MTLEEEINKPHNVTASSSRYREIAQFEELSPTESKVIHENKDGAFAGTSRLGIHFAGATSIGFGVEEHRSTENKYACNQDAILKAERKDGTIFLAVADGVGGKNAGDIASGTLAGSLLNGLMRYQDFPVSRLIKNAEVSLMHEYNLRRDNERRGCKLEGPYTSADMANMKTCLCMLELRPKKITLENPENIIWEAIPHNIGDSRLIIFTDPPFVTKENNKAVELNTSPNDVHFNDHVRTVTKCLGLKNGNPLNLEMDEYQSILLTPGTRFLLASDCLSDNLPFNDISLVESIVRNSPSGPDGSKEIVREIEKLIKVRGNQAKWDNFSVIAGEVANSIK